MCVRLSGNTPYTPPARQAAPAPETPAVAPTAPVQTPAEDPPAQAPAAQATAAASEAPPAEAAAADVQQALTTYASPAGASSPFSFSPKFSVGLKAGLMSDIGKYTNVSKVGVFGNLQFAEFKHPLTDKTSLGASANTSLGVSQKFYDYKGDFQTSTLLEGGLEMKGFVKAKLGPNYLKVGPTLGATGMWDMGKGKVGLDMYTGGQIGYENKKGTGVSLTYQHTLNGDNAGQGFLGAKFTIGIP